MTLFSTLYGQEQAKKILTAAVVNNRLAHAYIFAGPEGSGRLTAALDLAKARICPEVKFGFCGDCKHCKRIDSFNHPDVRITIPTTKTVKEEVASLFENRRVDGITPLRLPGNPIISIGMMREMGHRLSRKSFEGFGSVEIIYDAHKLRREAANAILKTLEEPPDGMLIILVSSRISGMLPTIRSRAHTVRFGRLLPPAIEKILELRTSLSKKDISEISMCSDGCPGKALLLARENLESNTRIDKLFSMIFDENIGDMELATEAEVMAREYGREGLVDIITDLILLVHDFRRRFVGSIPLSRHILPDIQMVSDRSCRRMENLLGECEIRVKANVSPAMAFSSAIVRSRY